RLSRADGRCPGMIQPRLVWELARKDLLLFAADRRGMALCFAVPIVLASAFGAIFHRPADTAGIRPVVQVAGQDDTPLSLRGVAGLCASDRLRAAAVDEATARRRLAEEGVVLILPAGFGRASPAPLPALTQPGSPRPVVRLLFHPRAGVESRWVEGVL